MNPLSSESSRQGRLERLIADYLRAVESGRPLDRDELLSVNPDLRSELEEFFRSRDALHAPTAPVCAEIVLDATIGLAESPVASVPRIRYFGDYELQSEIARGGMGVVFRARQVSLNRSVAVKMILAGQLADDEGVRRFRQEAEAAASLDHPNIVPIYEVGEHDGQHYFSMGLVEGGSLARRLTEGPLTPREAAALVETVATAVQFAHERGIIHRDLKPANILLDKDGRPRVTDFGLAKRTQAGQTMTETGQVLGTPGYMPPEQVEGRHVGPAADVYALGAVLYACLTGRAPFVAPTAMETMLLVLGSEAVAPRQLNPGVPRDLNTIVMKCLGKDSARRYRTAAEVAEDLRRFLNDEPILARPLGLVGRAWRGAKERPLASGCALSLIGVLVIALSVGTVYRGAMLVGTAIAETIEYRHSPAASFPASVGKPMTTPAFTLGTDGLGALELKMNVRSPSFETDENDQPVVHYNYRTRYTVLDDKGKRLHSGSSRMVWNSAVRYTENLSIDRAANEGTVTTAATIARFEVPPPGKIKVQLEILPDEVYESRADGVELRVYENVPEAKQRSLTGGAFCCLSPLLLLTGIVLLCYGPFLMTRRRQPRRPYSGTEPASKK